MEAADVGLDAIIRFNRKKGGSQADFASRGGGAVNIAKLLVSNLAVSVSNDDLAELFADVGNFMHSELHHDSQGRSLGTALVTFLDTCDAQRAHTMYNDVLFDGRPMRLELVMGAHFQESRPSVKDRIKFGGVQKAKTKPVRFKPSPRGGLRSKKNKEEPSLEQLDKEMDEYKQARDAKMDTSVKMAV